MGSGPRCPPGARGLLALLLLLLPGARGDCGAPPTPANAIPLHPRTGGFPVESIVQYKCIDGSVKIPGKSDTAVCLPNSEWRVNGVFCGRSCGVPPKFRSAALSKEDEMKSYYPPGTTVTYVCRPGYEPTELMTVATCLENVTWSESPESCKRKSCPAPEGPRNGRVLDGTDYLFGTRVNIICNDGFKLHGWNFIQCVLNGNPWTPLPTCEAISCLPPLNISHGSHNHLGEEQFAFGSSVTYSCDEGFSLIGEASIRCTMNDQGNGAWSGRAPECKGKPCRSLEVENGRAEFIDPQFGATVNFSCDDGYRRIGPASARCVISGSGVDWDKEVPFCERKSCGHPGELKNGRGVARDFLFGSVVQFICEEGYRMIGLASAQCVLRGNRVDWDKEVPVCQAIPCFPPPNIPHGSHSRVGEEEFPFGSAVTYSCDEGFSLIGEASIHCTTNDRVNGEWSGPAPECKAIPCFPPPNIPHGSHSRVGEEEFPFGSAVTYSCDEGFSLIGEASIHCTTNDRVNGEWSGPAPECKAIPCFPPPNIPHGSHSRVGEEEFPFGSAVTYSCDEGFSLIGEASIHCTMNDRVNGEWSGPAPECKAIPCFPPPNIPHGSHSRVGEEEFPFGSAVTYSCDEGFSLIGEASIHCTTNDRVNGEWSGPAPECKAIPCFPPPNIPHGSHSRVGEEEFPFGSAVTYSCDEGFSLIGEASIHCTTNDRINGEWSGPAPECKAIPCFPPPNIPHGSHSRVGEEEFPFGSAVTYSCDEGFSLIGEASIHCTTNDRVNGEWSGPAPECKAIPCFPPPNIPHGSHSRVGEEEFPFGSAVTYSCDEGFSLIGEASIHCTTNDRINGEWSGPAPECKGDCGLPPRFSFAELRTVVNNSSSVGTRLRYYCRSGYTQNEGKSPYVTCTETSTWSADPEFCVGSPSDTAVNSPAPEDSALDTATNSPQSEDEDIKKPINFTLIIIGAIIATGSLVSLAAFARMHPGKIWQNKKRSYTVNQNPSVYQMSAEQIKKILI